MFICVEIFTGFSLKCSIIVSQIIVAISVCLYLVAQDVRVQMAKVQV